MTIYLPKSLKDINKIAVHRFDDDDQLSRLDSEPIQYSLDFRHASSQGCAQKEEKSSSLERLED